MNIESKGHREQIKQARTLDQARAIFQQVQSGQYPARYVERCRRAYVMCGERLGYQFIDANPKRAQS